MNCWRVSLARRTVGGMLLALLFGAATAVRPAAAGPATRLDDAVVSIFVSTMLSNGRGTGFCVGDGSWVVTCYHVVSVHVGDGKDLPVEHVLVLSPWSGESVKADVVATDPKADLALLKLDHGRWPALPVASAEAFQPEKLASEKELFTIAGYGQTAAQIESDPEVHTMSTHAELLAAAQKAERQVLLFAPTTGAGPGWSGGPVVNERGLVVGVFRALVAQPQVRETWYPLATGVDPLRALLQAHQIPLTPTAAPLPKRGSEAGALFQREFRALAWGLARRWDRAETERRAELLLSPNDPLAHMGLSLALMWEGRLDQALKETEAALALDPKRASALFQKGLTLQRMSRLPEAEECMRRAVEMEPAEGERRITLGALLAAEGKTTEASAMLRRAVEMAPNHPLAHWRLGIALEAENKWDDAVIALRRASLLAEPLAPLRVIRVDLAEALEKARKPDEAEREWRELARTGDDPAIQYQLAAFLAGRQKAPEALQVIQKCLSLLEQHTPTAGAPDTDLLKRANDLKTKLEAKQG
jgi:tetratricopeptide (TPR) repeat protein